MWGLLFVDAVHEITVFGKSHSNRVHPSIYYVLCLVGRNAFIYLKQFELNIKTISKDFRSIIMFRWWQVISDFEKHQISVKSISYRKFPRSVVLSMYLNWRIFGFQTKRIAFWDTLGFVPVTHYTGSYDNRHNWLVSQLNLKFNRLRDVVNWTQMRKHWKNLPQNKFSFWCLLLL